jgi:hypothetical protein
MVWADGLEDRSNSLLGPVVVSTAHISPSATLSLAACLALDSVNVAPSSHQTLANHIAPADSTARAAR